MPSKVALATKDGATYTTSTGAPVAEPYAVQKIGFVGPLLLQGTLTLPIRYTPHSFDWPLYLDFHHIDLIAHFDRERIPERVVSSVIL